MENTNQLTIKSASLETVAGITSRLPAHTLPEFAFTGRSNVGKSSMVNALLLRKSLARVSQEPGKTQTINFYLVNDAFYLTDLPGYGYAKSSQVSREKWMKMVERYLKNSPTLCQVFQLIDMRHEPTALDLEYANWYNALGFTPYFILTKADKLSRNEQAKQKNVIRKALGAEEERLIPFSSVTKMGREEILEVIKNSCEIFSAEEN